MQIKAVAFDVDGTLYPNSRMYLLSLPMFLSHIRLIKAMDIARKQIRQNPENDDFHKVQARHLAKILKITPERAFALIEAKVYTNWFGIFKKLPVFKGLKKSLETFKRQGLKLAVMSDFPIRHRLEDLGLSGPWDSSFSSEETGHLKPHVEPFLRICQELNLPPENILYVGNSYSYDVMGAKAAGMIAAHLTKRPPHGSIADLSFKNYTELEDFVLKFSNSSTKGL